MSHPIMESRFFSCLFFVFSFGDIVEGRVFICPLWSFFPSPPNHGKPFFCLSMLWSSLLVHPIIELLFSSFGHSIIENRFFISFFVFFSCPRRLLFQRLCVRVSTFSWGAVGAKRRIAVPDPGREGTDDGGRSASPRAVASARSRAGEAQGLD